MAARTALSGIAVPAGTTRTPVAVTYSDTDPTNGNVYTLTGRDTILVKETGGADPITVAVTVPKDTRGNETDISFEVAASGEYVLPQPLVSIYGQPGGLLFLDWTGSGTAKVAILVNPT